MSMISGLIDRLRSHADLYDGLQRPCLAKELREAADTIWQLRDDLQRANAENDKLLNLLIDLKCAPCCGDSCWLHLPERLSELGIEVD